MKKTTNFVIIFIEKVGEKMKCLENLSRITYPKELVYDISVLYTFKGRDAFYNKTLSKQLSMITKSTIEKDIVYSAILLNLNVSAARVKAIVRRDSEPKTHDETMIRNLKNVFEILQKSGKHFSLSSNEFLSLACKLYKDVKQIKFVTDTKVVKSERSLLQEKVKVSRRDILDEAIKLYNNAITKDKIEATQAITNFFVDLMNMKLFNEENEFIALIIYYSLLQQNFDVFKYISFFEAYYKNKDDFDHEITHASYNWEQGYSKTDGINQLLISFLIRGYKEVEKQIEDANFDKKLTKQEAVESVILKLDEVFTRADIQRAAPTLSDATITRALDHLKEEGKIRPNGTGRSATWIRLTPKDMFQTSSKQLDIFSFVDMDE